MNTKFVVGLLASAALLASVAGADAKVIALKVSSGGTTNNYSTTFSTPTGAVASGPADTAGNVVYSASGTSSEATNYINLTLDTTSHNTVNTLETATYNLSVTGLTPQATIQAWEDLFSGSNPSFPTPAPHSVGAAAVKVFYDPANHLFAGGGPGSTATLIYDSSAAGCSSSGSGPYSCFASGPFSFSSVNPFSLTEVMTITYKQNSAFLPITATNSFSLVPEPTSLAMLGSGLLLAGFMFRRRRSGKA